MYQPSYNPDISDNYLALMDSKIKESKAYANVYFDDLNDLMMESKQRYADPFYVNLDYMSEN